MKQRRNLDKPVKKLFDNAIVLALVSGFLYCIGAVKLNEYLNVLSISPNILNKDTGQILFYGLMELTLPIVFGAMILCYVIPGLYAYMLFPMFLNIFERNTPRKRKLVKLRRALYCKNKDNDNPRVVSAKKAALPFIVLAIAIVVATRLLITAEQNGTTAATEILNRIAEKDVPDDYIAHVEVNGKLMSLYYIGCGSNLCAGIDLESHNLEYVKPEDISRPINIPKQLESTSSSSQVENDAEKAQ